MEIEIDIEIDTKREAEREVSKENTHETIGSAQHDRHPAAPPSEGRQQHPVISTITSIITVVLVLMIALPLLLFSKYPATPLLRPAAASRRSRRPWIYICIFIYIYIYIYIHTYIHTYIWAMHYPPLTFDHPAICKTSWRVGETTALVYK